MINSIRDKMHNPSSETATYIKIIPTIRSKIILKVNYDREVRRKDE
jgi:hypothetical protein